MRDLLLRLWREEHGWGRIWTGLAMAVALAGGGLVYQQVTQGQPAAGTANLWVDTNGGTCTRQSSAAAYVDGAACGSLDAAFDAASCADVVLIKAGTYGSQNVSGAKSCSATWAAGAVNGVTCTSCVDMAVAPAETVTLGGLTTTGANYFVLERGTGTDLNVTGGWGIVDTGDSQIVRDADFGNDIFFNASFPGPGTFTKIALVGGSVGPVVTSDGGTVVAVYLQTCASCSGAVGDHIVLDGVNFHDITTIHTGDPHTGVIRIDGGYSDVTIRNLSVYDNIDVVGPILSITNIETGAPDPTNVTVGPNNYFGTGSLGAIGFYPNVPDCSTFRVLYNTSIDSLVQSIVCSTATGMQWTGNLAPKGFSTCYGTYSKNVWQHNVNVACGTDTWVNGTAFSSNALGLGGTSGFDLQAGSPALQAGETSQCPAFDHDGNTRPNPGATNCDAGAYERNG